MVGMACDGHPSGLGRVFELTMTTFGFHVTSKTP